MVPFRLSLVLLGSRDLQMRAATAAAFNLPRSVSIRQWWWVLRQVRRTLNVFIQLYSTITAAQP